MISLITDIGLDHMAILGDTIEEITKVKAGIIKENQDTVMYFQENVTDIIAKTCKEKNNTLCIADLDAIKNYSFDNKFQKFDYKNYKNILINLKGECQVKNSLLAIETTEILKSKGYDIKEECVREGLKNVIHKARFEVLSESPKVIFDGGHNEDAIRNLKNSIDMYYPNEEKIYIVSILKSKDYKTVLELLTKGNKQDIFIFTSRK